MASNCSAFKPNIFKPTLCSHCFQNKEYHQDSAILNDNLLSTIRNISNGTNTAKNDHKLSEDEVFTDDSLALAGIQSKASKSRSERCHSDKNVGHRCNQSASATPDLGRSSDSRVLSLITKSDSDDSLNYDDVQHSTDSNETEKLKRRPLCRYGWSCYRTNPDHFRRYSHPAGHQGSEKSSNTIASTTDRNSSSEFQQAFNCHNECNARLRKKLRKQKKSELHFIQIVEEKVHSLIEELHLKREEVDKLRQDTLKWAKYNEQLEMALLEEVDRREKREALKQVILSFPRATPSYWGTDSLEQPYRETPIALNSPEFDRIKVLMNSTIKRHENRYGTVNGQDPTEFLINRIVRIYNDELWHFYCFTKDKIIRKTHGKLDTCASSIYLQKYPLLTPLLDKKTNEYWLFHGCSMTSLNQLLHDGYDPRVSNLKGMFGGGFYLAENSSKSNQYIPCPQCQQNCISTTERCNCPNQENLVFAMVLFRATLGDTHIVLRYDREKYRVGSNNNRVRRPPKKPDSDTLYDSVMGESMAHGGDTLKCREFILYDRGQAYPEYVIYFRRSPKAAVSWL